MDKTQILQFIASQLQAGTITVADLLPFTQSAVPAPSMPGTVIPETAAAKVSSNHLINIFYAIGGIVVISGIVILIAQYWSDLGYAGRVAVTLGIGGVTFIAGLLQRGPGSRIISQVFLTLAFVLLPLGIGVVLDEADINPTLELGIGISSGLAALYVVAWAFTRRNVTILYTVIYASAAYYATVIKFADYKDALIWATIVLGISYLLLGCYVRSATSEDSAHTKERNSVRTLLYFFGTLAVLGGAISLGGIWDIVLIAVIFGFFYLSVFLRSRGILVLSGIFLIGHLIHLTTKYFADVIGWPIALVICGFIIMGCGYGTYYLGKMLSNKQ